MGTTAQTFYQSTGADDYAAPNEVNIRKLVIAAGASLSTTITAHPNAAGTTAITLNPYTTSSTASDIRNNLGWSINRLGTTDGMESAAATPRVIPPGAWTFALGVSVPIGATGTGALSVTYAAAVYRVSSAGVKTLLFTATSAAVASNSAAAASGNPVATSAAQPEYALDTGETIQVGYLATCVQTAGLAGVTVAGNVTWSMGDTAAYVQVPAPGVRTRYVGSLTETVTATTDALARQLSVNRTGSESAAVSEALTRRFTGSRSMSDNVPVTETLARQLSFPRSLADTVGGVVNNFRPVIIFEG